MQYYKKNLPLFLILIASSAFGKTTSRVTNKTDNTIKVYWTAAGCAGVHDKITETCKYQYIAPNTTGVYAFKNSQTNIQIKVSAFCKKDNSKNAGSPYTFYCPSGPWHIDGGHAAVPTCKLHGKGRGHVRIVIVDNFNAYQTVSSTCSYINQ